MLKLRLIGIRDYSVFDGEQRIGRIRFAGERLPPIWLWNVIIHLPGGLPMGLGQRPRHRQGRLQGGLGSPEGQKHAGAVVGSLQGLEHSRRRVKAASCPYLQEGCARLFWTSVWRPEVFPLQIPKRPSQLGRGGLKTIKDTNICRCTQKRTQIGFLAIFLD